MSTSKIHSTGYSFNEKNIVGDAEMLLTNMNIVQLSINKRTCKHKIAMCFFKNILWVKFSMDSR